MALGANLTENGLVRIASETVLAMRAGVSRDVMEVHRMHAHPSEDITRKTAEMMGIETTCQWGAYYITPQKLPIKCVRTDNGGEFEGEFQSELDRRSITHEHTPPDTPQYNGVAKRVLGLLREKAATLMEELDDVINVPREKLWVQPMLFACDVTDKSVTTSTDGGKFPYELWFGKFPTVDHLRPFGAVGYARQRVREHKMVPKGEKCVFMEIPRNFPTGTVSVLLVRTRKIVERQAVGRRA